MQNLRLKLATLSAFSLLVIISGCDVFAPDDDEGGMVTLTGQILNEVTNNPVEGGFVRVMPFDLLFEADSVGGFNFEVDIDSTMELQITASADGFSTQTIPVQAIAERVINIPSFQLFSLVDETATSGVASNIILLSQSASVIGVRESGSTELASLTFQLADSVGNPVILEQSTLVNFRFGVRPNGGEFVSPSSIFTDNSGIVKVNLSSGTRSGVVQIVAETTIEGHLIRSQPVALTIHGGLPDQTHFSLGPQSRNFPGLNAFGLTNTITVIVGDKYSNPVRSGSAVHFETTHGIVEGSTLTDERGQGTVDLISSNPLPADGIAHVTARTANDEQAVVSAITPIVFSGTPVITVSPTSAAPNQTYTFTITDFNGNPLVSGTSITVEVEGTAITASGSTAIVLNDTGFSGGIDYEHVIRGPGITEFTFVVAEDVDPSNPETPIVDSITIATNGPNGSLQVVLSGVGEPFSTTDGAFGSKMANGIYRFELSAPPSHLR